MPFDSHELARVTDSVQGARRTLAAASLGLALAAIAGAAPAPEAARPAVRVVRIKAVADEAFREKKSWQKSIREHVEWSDPRMREAAGVGLELVAIEPWTTHESASMVLLLRELRIGVDKGDADIVVGFTGHPPPAPPPAFGGRRARKPRAFIAGIALPLGDRAVVRRTPHKKDVRHTLLHEIAHLFGALHVDEKSLLQPRTDRSRLTLDDFNGRVLELTRDRDFDRGVRDLSRDERAALIALYRQSPVRARDDPDTAIRIAYLYLLSGEVDEALAAFREAMQVDPENSHQILRTRIVPRLEAYAAENEATVETRFMLGQAYFVANDRAAAARHLAPNCDAPRAHAPSCSLLGAVHLKSSELRVAERRLLRALAVDDAQAEAYNTLAGVYAAGGLYPEALENFDRAQELAPDEANVHYNKGLTYLVLGQPGAAEACFREILRMNPANAEAKVKLALALARQGQSKEARKLIEPIEKRQQLPAFVLRDMAEVRFYSGDEKRAFKYVELAKKGAVDVTAVEALIREGTRKPPETRVDDLVEQAVAYFRTRQYATARDLLEKGVERDPRDPRIHLWIGRIDREEDRLDEATRRFGRSLELDADFAPAYFSLATVAHRQGDCARVVELLESYMEHAKRAGSRSHYLRGLCHLELAQLDHAETYLRGAILRRSDYGSAFYSLGRTYRAQGRNDDARKELRLAVESGSLPDSDRPEAHLLLARLLTEAGDLEDARRHATMAARLGNTEALNLLESSPPGGDSTR